MLTVEDAAILLKKSKKTVYGYINANLIPVVDFGFDVTLIDPAAWAQKIEMKNPHLKPSAREYIAA